MTGCRIVFYVLTLVVWATDIALQVRATCTTEDKPYASFFFVGQENVKYTCSEFVAEDYCLCTMDAVRDACCASCAPYEDQLSTCNCQDHVSETNYILAVNTKNETKGTLRNCNTLVKDFPTWCNDDENIRDEQCCQSCKWQRDDCFDNSTTFKVGDNAKRFSCSEFIALDPCHCIDYKYHCCYSCQFIDTSKLNCSCRDGLFKNAPAKVRNADTNKVLESVESCQDLVEKYPQACQDPDVSGLGGCCCESCQSIDTSCHDLVNDKLPIQLKRKGKTQQTIKSCSDMTNDYPELCKQFGKKGCCQSCKGVDTSCLNTNLNKWRLNGVSYECAEYVSQDPCYCDVQPGLQKLCCESCKELRKKPKDIAHCCEDDPDYVMTHSKCPNCTCQDLFDTKKKKTLRKMCKRNTGKVAKNCCQTCRKAGAYVSAK